MQPPGPDFFRYIGAQFRSESDAGRELDAIDHEDGTWTISGGPSDLVLRRSLRNKFRDLAIRAATAAGLVDGESPLDAWLNRLKSQSPHYVPVEVGTEPVPQGAKVVDGGWIDRLFLASAEVCVTLETDAFVLASVASQPVTGAEKQTRFPNRAAWLDREIAAKDLTPNRLKVLGGLDPRTTARIRQGERVGRQVLHKLARALSIPPDQIPND